MYNFLTGFLSLLAVVCFSSLVPIILTELSFNDDPYEMIVEDAIKIVGLETGEREGQVKSVTFVDHIEGKNKGQFTYTNGLCTWDNKIFIKQGMPKTQTIMVIFHELVHVADHTLTESQTNKRAVELMEENGYVWEAFVERFANVYRLGEYRY
ncbi:MAG: hypothetical protein LBH47_00040 [Christensenellaceae bacterium]|nr:hypothetical protein [Christensenellaceae bacterium]